MVSEYCQAALAGVRALSARDKKLVANKPVFTRICQVGNERFMLHSKYRSTRLNITGLHFLPTKQTFSAPTPLLLASMLYVSSLRHSTPELAALSSDYFTVMCSAISELCIPPVAPENTAATALTSEESAFQDVLGIILAGLTCEASTKTTGVWISIGYRLILESCPKEAVERSREWRRIFSGLQVCTTFYK
jgi:hypothetical protein